MWETCSKDPLPGLNYGLRDTRPTFLINLTFIYRGAEGVTTET